jgi:hypothetical protein
MKKIIGILLVSIFAMPAFSATEVRDSVLSQDIVDRDADGAIDGGVCGNEENSVSIDSNEIQRVYLWNRVSNDEDRRLIHSWQQEVDGQWAELANVSLRIGASSGWRTWSSKNFDPSFHKGDWRVVVSAEDALEDVLCVVHFSVK